MPVDSFKYLPRSIAAYYQTLVVKRVDPIPWTPLSKPLDQCRFGLVTTAGIYDERREPPFDAEREKREPMWGDPTYRRIGRDVGQAQIGASHLHINNRDILADVNVVLPVSRFGELEEQGVIGSLAAVNYSFMGYQPNTSEWRERYGPEVAGLMKDEAVDAVLLTPV
jgi:D-proline reductase (dithiol) PrdB